MSILLEFDTNYILGENQLDQYFYEDFRPSIKLWIDKKGRKLDGWDDLVKRATRAESKAHISNNHHLDQRCLQDTYLIQVTIGIKATST